MRSGDCESPCLPESSPVALPPAQSHVAPPPDVAGLIELAERLQNVGHSEDAVNLLSEAAGIDPTPAARIALAVLLAEEHPHRAIEELERAWDHARRLQSPPLRALCCGNLAVLSERLGQLDRAARYRQHALRAQMELAADDLDAALPTEALIDLAASWLSTPEDANWAESLLNAAAAGCPGISQQARIASHRGVIAARAGRTEQAIVHWAQAQRQFRQVGESAGTAHTLVNLGHLLQHQQRPEMARRAFLIARDLFEESDRPRQAERARRFAGEAAALDRLTQANPDWN